jgi:hypothetical protein
MQPKNFLRTLSLIHYSLCAGLVLFLVFVYWQNGNFDASPAEGDIFVYVVPVIAMLGYFGSKFSYRKMIQNLPKDGELQTKLARYQVASIVQYALIEGPAFLALFIYLQSGTALYLVIALALVIYLFAQRPSLEKLLREVPMSFEEKKQFDTFSR